MPAFSPTGIRQTLNGVPALYGLIRRGEIDIFAVSSARIRVVASTSAQAARAHAQLAANGYKVDKPIGNELVVIDATSETLAAPAKVARRKTATSASGVSAVLRGVPDLRRMFDNATMAASKGRIAGEVFVECNDLASLTRAAQCLRARGYLVNRLGDTVLTVR